MTRSRPVWLPVFYAVALVFGMATVVLASIALVQITEAWQSSAAVHSGHIHSFQIFGVAALVSFKTAFLLFLAVNARSNMDRTYSG